MRRVMKFLFDLRDKFIRRRDIIHRRRGSYEFAAFHLFFMTAFFFYAVIRMKFGIIPHGTNSHRTDRRVDISCFHISF